MIKIVLNGEECEINENTGISGLLTEKGINPSVAVVEYNGKIVPKENFGEKIIEEGAVLEVLRFVGGG